MKLAAGLGPKETPVMFVICRPVMVTEVPPAGAPLAGLTPVTMGALV